MKLIELEQGTNSWLDYRRSRITATEFCIVAADVGLCNNLFNKSVNTLIKDKLTGELQPDNIYFQMGRKFEPILMQQYNGVDLVAGQIGTYAKNERIMSSFDGLDWFAERIVEIKTTSKPVDKLDEIVDYYKFQVAHQCYTAGFDSGLIIIGFLINGEISEVKQVEIVAKKVITKTKWLELCNEFLAKLDNANIAPPEVLHSWNEYRLLDEQIKLLEAQKEALKSMLIDKYPQGATFSQFSVVKVAKNSYKYADYVKDNKLEIPDEYKSSSISLQLKNNVKEETK